MSRKPERRIKGVIHFHSNYSYDGRDNIRDIVAFLKSRGCSFVFLTEHDDDFNEEKMERFVEECEATSSRGFLVVPGIEFRCRNKVHILGLGLRKFVRREDPEGVATWIRDNGGKAVIAHPIKYQQNIGPKLINLVNGVEIWNSHKDSRFIPNYRMLELFRIWKKINPLIIPICGSDNHGVIDNYPIICNIKESRLEFEDIWKTLSKDDVIFASKFFKLRRISSSRLETFRIKMLWNAYAMVRKVRRISKCFH